MVHSDSQWSSKHSESRQGGQRRTNTNTNGDNSRRWRSAGWEGGDREHSSSNNNNNNNNNGSRNHWRQAGWNQNEGDSWTWNADEGTSQSASSYDRTGLGGEWTNQSRNGNGNGNGEESTQEAAPQNPNQKRVNIPRQLIGMFVGKGGAAIKGISAQAGCAAHVDDMGDENEDAMVVIGGPNDVEENIEWAVQLVQDRISRLQRIRAVEQGDVAQVSRHVNIPSHLVGAFVGKGGTRIKDICARAGCSAYVEDESGVDGQAMIVVGRGTESPESIELGVQLVQQRIADMHKIERKEVVKAAIPSHLVGLFVGKNGIAIKDICARAGCHAHVDDEGGKDGEAVVVVGNSKDSPEGIERGLMLVQQRIAELQDAASVTPQSLNDSATAGTKGVPRVDVNAEIRNMLRVAEKRGSPLIMADLDYKVVLFLRQLHGRHGRHGVRAALAHLIEATAARTREGVRSWPAYTLTLLRRFDYNAWKNDRNHPTMAALDEADLTNPDGDSPSEDTDFPGYSGDWPEERAHDIGEDDDLANVAMEVALAGLAGCETLASVPSPARDRNGGSLEKSYDNCILPGTFAGGLPGGLPGLPGGMHGYRGGPLPGGLIGDPFSQQFPSNNDISLPTVSRFAFGRGF